MYCKLNEANIKVEEKLVLNVTTRLFLFKTKIVVMNVKNALKKFSGYPSNKERKLSDKTVEKSEPFSFLSTVLNEYEHLFIICLFSLDLLVAYK